MTLREFVTECELYPYSKENYELIKEEYECDLMSKYLESADYIQENTDLISEASGFLVEGFMFEAEAIKAGTDDVKEKLALKAKNLLGNIKARLIKILNGFLSFLGLFGKQLEKAQKTAEDVMEKMSVAAKEIKDGVKGISEDQKTRTKDLITAAEDRTHITFKEGKGINVPKRVIGLYGTSDVTTRVGMALTNDDVIVLINKNNEFEKALTPDQINSIFRKAFDKNLNQEKLDGIINELNSAYDTNNAGVRVPGSPKVYNDVMADLRSYQATTNVKSAEADANQNQGNLQWRSLLANLSTSVANTIKLYKRVVEFKSIVSNGLISIFNNVDTGEKTEKADNKKQKNSESDK